MLCTMAESQRGTQRLNAMGRNSIIGIVLLLLCCLRSGHPPADLQGLIMIWPHVFVFLCWVAGRGVWGAVPEHRITALPGLTTALGTCLVLMPQIYVLSLLLCGSCSFFDSFYV